ncbi:MAG: hypothetical protein GC185_12840 [Alphaproteobacteria bacterium]|nr:hypothetical protein [Alphaproteobacteria bacterium]
MTTKFFDAAALPSEPAIPQFKIRRESEMNKLRSSFMRAGVTFYMGKKSIFMSPPTNDHQKRKLQAEGIDPYVCQKKCSPRRS